MPISDIPHNQVLLSSLFFFFFLTSISSSLDLMCLPSIGHWMLASIPTSYEKAMLHVTLDFICMYKAIGNLIQTTFLGCILQPLFTKNFAVPVIEFKIGGLDFVWLVFRNTCYLQISDDNNSNPNWFNVRIEQNSENTFFNPLSFFLNPFSCLL